MSLASGDLTTLATIKAYLVSAPGDPVLSGLITRMSSTIRAILHRPFLLPRNYSEVFNGTGTTSLVLPNWPLLSLSSLSIDGAVASSAPVINDSTYSNPYGYRFPTWDGIPPGNPAVLELVGGGAYFGGNQNIAVAYRAGYQVTGEVPDGPSYSPLSPFGIWATDEGVSYTSSGTALVVTTGTSPTVGHYVPPNSSSGQYLFNSSDISSGLLINYGFIPGALEQACIELVMDRASYRSRVGVRSQSLASQETMSFGADGISDTIRDMLQPFINVVPPAIGANS